MELFSVTFLIFLGGALLIYYLLPKIARPLWLLVCSYAFYLYGLAHVGYVALLASATLITWGAALALDHTQRRWLRRLLLALAAAACLVPLGYFKYTGFFRQVAAELAGLAGFSLKTGAFDVVLPLGISYFTFQALGYVFDVYGGKYRAERNPLYYALFVSFFPCIVTGPIGRGGEMLPQLRRRTAFDYNTFTGGVFRILYGFFKKLVIAGLLAGLIENVLTYPMKYSGPTLVVAALLFTAELYFDFSSCSDIAIGAGACFGITVRENFHRPLAAPSFKKLWDCWHMSLTSWLEDYIFEPLAWSGWEKHLPGIGKKLQGHPTTAALFLTYLVSGFWHGASWNYILWGLLNGLFLYIGSATRKKRKKLNRHNPFFTVPWLAPIRRIFQTSFTYCLFSFTLVFFWVDLYAGGDVSAALAVYARMFTNGWAALRVSSADFLAGLTTLGFTPETLLVLLAAILLANLLETAEQPLNIAIRRVPIWLRWPLYYVLMAAILFYGAFGQSAFIYQAY